jgi:hypothetical protein
MAKDLQNVPGLASIWIMLPSVDPGRADEE